MLIDYPLNSIYNSYFFHFVHMQLYNEEQIFRKVFVIVQYNEEKNNQHLNVTIL